MDLLSVTSEIYPLIKTGGLADVAGALPAALGAHHVAVKTLVPGYPQVMSQLRDTQVVIEYEDLFDGSARILAGRAAGLDLFVIDAPHLYNREGGPYGGASGDYADNWKRYAGLSFVAAELSRGKAQGYEPDVMQAHDWQSALAPAYVAYGGGRRKAKTVMTIHNLAFQGQFGRDIFWKLQLPPEAFSMSGVEYYGGVGFLKAGIQTADAVTTVSPTYAAEIRTREFGMGLDGLLNVRSDRLHGILNGIDTDAWDPGTDPFLHANYRLSTIKQREENKLALETRFGLNRDDGPLFGLVSRLTWQKGIDILSSCIDPLVNAGGRLVVLGSGDDTLESAMASAAWRHPGRVGFERSYDEPLSHLIQGGVDAILVPSRFEPCGLTQLFGLRYGAVPVVSRVGGLADTVIDANLAAVEAGVATGVQFSPVSQHALLGAINRTIALYRDERVWSRMRRNGMKFDVGWHASAAKYVKLFRELLGQATEDDDSDS
ncbi:MAG: glycogen synthase GlgA [Alphaproteobacteria bacterium]|nr:glycogen synthase GlgA [Alphaproteobacteria bacterium]